MSESKQVNECGMMDQAPLSPNIPTVQPVSMSVNLNAQGIDNIKELIQLMHKADSPLAAGPVAVDNMPPMPMPTVGMDAPLNVSTPALEPQGGMDPLDAIIKSAGMAVKPKELPAPEQGPGDNKGGDEAGTKSPVGSTEGDKEPAPKDEMNKVADEVRDMADTLADENSDGGFADATSEPDEKTQPASAVIPTGDDLASKGDEAPKKNGGGNPMESIRSMLDARYKEIKEGKKSKPDFLDMDKDGDKKEPMKKAVKDKEVAEGWDDMIKSVQDKKGTGKFDKKEIKPGVTQYTRKSSTFSDGGDDADTKKAKQKAKK